MTATSATTRSPFHVAVFVDDLERCSLGAVAPWMPPLRGEPTHVFSSTGSELFALVGRSLRSDGTIGCGAVVEEVVEGSLVRPEPGNRWHHVAFFCDDLRADVERLEGLGFIREVW